MIVFTRSQFISTFANNLITYAEVIYILTVYLLHHLFVGHHEKAHTHLKVTFIPITTKRVKKRKRYYQSFVHHVFCL